MQKWDRPILLWLSRCDHSTPTEIGEVVMGATREQSTVYACRVLRPMLAAGLVSVHKGPNKARYSITEAGRAAIR